MLRTPPANMAPAESSCRSSKASNVGRKALALRLAGDGLRERFRNENMLPPEFAVLGVVGGRASARLEPHYGGNAPSRTRKPKKTPRGHVHRVSFSQAHAFRGDRSSCA